MTHHIPLNERASGWVNAGLISSDQADAIVAHEAAVSESPGARIAGTIGVIGAMLVGLGVLSTVAANWGSVPDPLKVVVIVATMLVAYGAGMAAELRQAPRWMANAGYVIGTLVFAGGVFLIGQIYNVRAHDPLGFLAIAITASAVTLLARARPVGWIAALAWFAWVIHELIWSVGDASNDRSTLVVYTAALMLGCLALTVGWMLARVKWRDDRGPIDAEALGLPLRTVALVGLLGGLTTASFIWRANAIDGTSAGVTPAWVVVLIATVASVIAFEGLHRDRTTKTTALALAIAVIIIAASPFAPSFTLLAIGANLVLLGGGVGLLLLGLVAHRSFEYSWGVAWIIVLVAARYIDVLASFAFGGLAFVGAGLLLFGIAWAIGRSRRLWKGQAE